MPRLTFPGGCLVGMYRRIFERAKNQRHTYRDEIWHDRRRSFVFRLTPWTFCPSRRPLALKKASEAQKIDYPKPDGVVSFDRNSSVFLSGTNHEENQPTHLTLKDRSVPISHNLALYDAPDSAIAQLVFMKLCAMTMVVIPDCKLMLKIVFTVKLVISKTQSNIVWVSPEGGGGPVLQICEAGLQENRTDQIDPIRHRVC